MKTKIIAQFQHTGTIAQFELSDRDDADLMWYEPRINDYQYGVYVDKYNRWFEPGDFNDPWLPTDPPMAEILHRLQLEVVEKKLLDN